MKASTRNYWVVVGMLVLSACSTVPTDQALPMGPKAEKVKQDFFELYQIINRFEGYDRKANFAKLSYQRIVEENPELTPEQVGLLAQAVIEKHLVREQVEDEIPHALYCAHGITYLGYTDQKMHIDYLDRLIRRKDVGDVRQYAFTAVSSSHLRTAPGDVAFFIPLLEDTNAFSSFERALVRGQIYGYLSSGRADEYLTQKYILILKKCFRDQKLRHLVDLDKFLAARDAEFRNSPERRKKLEANKDDESRLFRQYVREALERLKERDSQ